MGGSLKTVVKQQTNKKTGDKCTRRDIIAVGRYNRGTETETLDNFISGRCSQNIFHKTSHSELSCENPLRACAVDNIFSIL